MASRQIPIDVDPAYEANFRNRRRDSEPVTEIPRDVPNRRFQRRHSEDPNKHSWAHTYHKSPFATSFADDQMTARRGSMPVHLERPRPKRDRFDEIVARLMKDDNIDFLSEVDDFNPFRGQDSYGDEAIGHTGLQRRASAPVSRPFTMNPKKDYVEIPVQIIREDDNEAEETCTSRKVDNVDSTACTGNTEQVSEATMTNSPKMVEDAVQTDDGVVIVINEDDTKNPAEPLKNDNTDTQKPKDADDIEVNAETHSLKGDEEKLRCIKELEERFKQTHEMVTAFEKSDRGSDRECFQLEELLMKTLMSLDAVEANGSQSVRDARRSVVMKVQEDLKKLEMKNQQK